MKPQVLVPVETLEGGHPALQWAMLNFPAAKLFPLYVHQPLQALPRGAGVLASNRAALDADRLEQVRRDLAGFGQGIIAEGSDPAAEILNRAWDGGFNLIVMGRAVKGRLERFFLGSVAEAVIRESPLPVISVRDELGLPQRTVERILVLHDLSADAETAHQSARLFFPDARVELLHVLEGGPVSLPSTLSRPVRQEVETNIQQGHAERRAQVETALGALGGGEVQEGNAVEIALKRAASGAYDLLVVGQSSRGTLDRLLIGSVAQRLLRESAVPVLIARNIAQPQ